MIKTKSLQINIGSEEILPSTVVVESFDNLQEVLEYLLVSENTLGILWLQVPDNERNLCEKLIISYYKKFNLRLILYMNEPLNRELLVLADRVNKKFNIYNGIIIDTLLQKVSNQSIQLKLNEFFTNLFNRS